LYAICFWILALASSAAPDTLVVCPAEFQPALAPWSAYRRAQGHQILIVEPPPEPAELTATIRRVAQTGRLKFVLLVGDVPHSRNESPAGPPLGVPTNYAAAKINTRWGSEPTIATDTLYADTDGDDTPDIALGRIPADSKEELAAALGKVLRYERAESGDWQRRLNVVVGAGGFGAVTDAIVEAAGRRVIQQSVPADYDLRHVRHHELRSAAATPGQLSALMRRQLSENSLAWIYLGHGLPTELDRIRASHGHESILSIHDVTRLRCGAQSPLAVLVACYTGAFDAEEDCLAEELSLAADGPVAVIAATRVTMPYGNTVLGYELLQSCFSRRASCLGDIMLLAQCRARQKRADDPLRNSLDAMCIGLCAAPGELAAERQEHVLMYHLLGDPLLRLRTIEPSESQPAAAARSEDGSGN
jgi:Peptidase family C25